MSGCGWRDGLGTGAASLSGWWWLERGWAGGGDVDPQGLLGEEGTPTGEEVVVPPARRIVRAWCANGDAPTKMMRGVHPRSEWLVHVGGVQPTGELGVCCDAALETPGEADQSVGTCVAAVGGKGLLVVDLPE